MKPDTPHMEDKLLLLAHLYGEAPDDAPPLGDLLQDPGLAAEYRALSEARFAVDHRDRPRPSARAVDAIVAGSVPRPRPGHADRWLDRPALRLLPVRRRTLVPVFAVAAALALTLMVRPWDLLRSSPAPAEMAGAADALTVPPESLFRALPPAAQTVAQPAWDSGDDLRQLHRRIRSLQAAGVTEWDEPAVPLELLPAGSGTGGLRPAGSRR